MDVEVDLKNLAETFVAHALQNPLQPALTLPLSWSETNVQLRAQWTYGEVLDRVRQYRQGLLDEGFTEGDKVVILIPLSLELYAFVIALFAAGMVPVFLEPGMKMSKMLQAINDSKAKALVSVDALLKFRLVLPPLWKTKIYTTGKPGFLKKSFEDFKKIPRQNLTLARRKAGDHALITFTTGTTGRPKGADRNHGILSTQHLLSREFWPEAGDEVDMPAFPMIGFQNLSCGITTVLPAFDNNNLESLRPSVIVNQILESHVTRLSAAPFFLKIITENLINRGLRAPSVRSLIAGGAPVPRTLCEKILRVFPNAESFVVYGSTEVEPISYVKMNDVCATPGEGYLVGLPLDVLKIKLSETGEVMVHGPHVVRRYLNNDTANRETKVLDDEGRLWHRTGDTASQDSSGRLWLTGRLVDHVWRLGKLTPNYVLEQKLEQEEGIARLALINDGNEVAAFVELRSDAEKRQPLAEKIKARCEELGIPLNETVFLPTLPVDRRHRWKIDRQALRKLL